ncbi:MAG: hypothetical protein AABW92_01160 [Nanoarchaeota archaeon]
MRKKSQITIFIVVAITLILLTSIFFIFYNKKQLSILQQSDETNLKQIIPVKVYVEEAMEDLLIEGLFLVGKQGGKIYETTWPDCKEENPSYSINHRMCNQKGFYDYGYPNYLANSPYRYKRIAIGINHSRVDSEKRLTQSSDEPLLQPFAYPHIGKVKGVNYLYGLHQPLPSITYYAGEPSIEFQLSRWIENHLLEVTDFSEFKSRGFDVVLPDEPPKVDVKINEKFITVQMNYSLIVHKGGLTYHVDEFYSQIESDFRRTYEFINEIIKEDISTISMMIRQKLYNENAEVISVIEVHESFPKNFEYDVVNVTITSMDYRKKYNYDEQYFNFYFIRENRPPDAGTVKLAPPYFYPGETATWFCENMKNGEKAFDPDEDDYYTKQPYPWTNPQLYIWYSRGDYLTTKDVESCESGVLKKPEITNLLYHNDPYNEEKGPLFMDRLPNCGNSDNDISTTAVFEDVGDVIILKVQDEQDFPPGGRVEAPLRYPAPQILEDGTGRLNDAISFRPVKCQTGVKWGAYETCKGGYWDFMGKTTPEYKEDIYCVRQCSYKYKVDKFLSKPIYLNPS